MLTFSLLKKEGITSILEQLQQEAGDNFRCFDCGSFVHIDIEGASGYLTSLVGSCPLIFRLKINDQFKIEIPSDFIDAVYVM